MKKTLALVLALMMMATIAFAADFVPGSDIGLGSPAQVAATEPEADFAFVSTATPAVALKAINSDNYSVSKIKWDEGKALVSGVAIDDDDDVVYVTLKQDYNMTKEKTLDGTVTIREKGSSNYFEAEFSATVAYLEDKTTLGFSATDSEESIDAGSKITKKTIYKVDAPKGSGMLLLTGEGFEVSVKVFNSDKHYLYADAKVNKTVITAYADSDAELNFFNFKGNPTFSANATVSFYDLEEDSYVYELKNDKLTLSNAKWNKDSGAWELKTRTLGSYVTSDIKLNVAAATTTNPNTGASDVVGIATALAAVVLVSAAAISIKK